MVSTKTLLLKHYYRRQGSRDVAGTSGRCPKSLRNKNSQCSILGPYTILTDMMADEFNSLRPEIKNYKAEADADLLRIPGQLELHGRCRCGVLLSPYFGALFVADLIVGMEELELHCRCRGRSNFRKIRIATISIRMVLVGNHRLQTPPPHQDPDSTIFFNLILGGRSESLLRRPDLPY